MAPPEKTSRGLIVFLRNPVPGQVKTRLAAGIGPVAALHIYQKLVDHTLQAAADSGAQMYLFYDQRLPETSRRIPDAQYHLQEGMDLGARMYNAFNVALNDGCDQLVIIGSDCPGLTVDLIQRAFVCLREYDSVLGPAADGGYYLLGVTSPHPSLFTGKNWSTETVLEDTLVAIRSLNWSVTTLPTLTDIDTVDDLRQIRPDWLIETGGA